jgi:RNA ligase (TIGR02306 family)
MATQEVKIYKVTIEPHPNADSIELAKIGEYRSIVRKGDFKTGDLVVYIPEQSLVPDEILEPIGLKGKLSGLNKNRVKAIKLRGVLSQGIVMKARPEFTEGQDVADILGITKWEPEIPSSLREKLFGDVFPAGLERCVNFNVENYKKNPELIKDGEFVVFTEKIHGTFVQFGFMPESLAHPEQGRIIVSSKGLAKQGLALKESDTNLYWKAFKTYITPENCNEFLNRANLLQQPIFILGEIYGKGVQDLSYGLDNFSFRAFAYFTSTDPRLNSPLWLDTIFGFEYHIPIVPILYKGPFSKEVLEEYTNGKTTLDADHTREGVVINFWDTNDLLRSKCYMLKSISEEYLLRKNGTEFN